MVIYKRKFSSNFKDMMANPRKAWTAHATCEARVKSKQEEKFENFTFQKNI
jgi:hypothetical protein